MRGIDGWIGSGLRFTLWPDRALDIGAVWFKDKPVSWVYPALGSPEYYEPSGSGWLRTFGGGLMVTGGLTHFGAPDEFESISYSQQAGLITSQLKICTFGKKGRVNHMFWL